MIEWLSSESWPALGVDSIPDIRTSSFINLNIHISDIECSIVDLTVVYFVKLFLTYKNRLAENNLKLTTSLKIFFSYSNTFLCIPNRWILAILYLMYNQSLNQSTNQSNQSHKMCHSPCYIKIHYCKNIMITLHWWIHRNVLELGLGMFVLLRR